MKHHMESLELSVVDRLFSVLAMLRNMKITQETVGSWLCPEGLFYDEHRMSLIITTSHKAISAASGTHQWEEFLMFIPDSTILAYCGIWNKHEKCHPLYHLPCC